MSPEPLDDEPVGPPGEAQEIARRALALFSVVATAFGAPRKDVVAWLHDEGRWEERSPSELAFMSAQQPTERESIQLGDLLKLEGAEWELVGVDNRDLQTLRGRARHLAGAASFAAERGLQGLRERDHGGVGGGDAAQGGVLRIPTIPTTHSDARRPFRGRLLAERAAWRGAILS